MKTEKQDYKKCIHAYDDEQYTEDDYWLVTLCGYNHYPCRIIDGDGICDKHEE